jgi:hypothetical protein
MRLVFGFLIVLGIGDVRQRIALDKPAIQVDRPTSLATERQRRRLMRLERFFAKGTLHI